MEEYLKDGAFGTGLTDDPDTESVDTPEFVYSTDEETFFEEIEDLDFGDADEGEKVIIYRGNPKKISHMDILNEISVIELMQSFAYDEDGDMAEDYLEDVSEEVEEEIKKAINSVLCKYAKQPGYCRVENIKPISITIGDFD